MHSAQIKGGKPPTEEGPMMSRQKDLPSQPVPPLQDTLRRYLDFLKPLVTAQELEETREVVYDFGKPGGDGERLHRLLVAKASRTENWLSDVTREEIFLKSRNSVISTSVAVILPRQAFTTKRDQLKHAAVLVAGALNFKHLIDSQLLLPEFKGSRPLDMSQFQILFGACRIPCEGCDKAEFNEPNEESGKHVIVIYNDQVRQL